MIKDKIIMVLATIALICGTLLYFSYTRTKQLDDDLKTAMNNYKVEVNKNLMYQFSMKDLQASKDSSDMKVLELVKQLKIKPKRVVETIYIANEFSKRDTITITDSVFIKDYKTSIGDKWYNLDIEFKAPDELNTDLRVNNEVIAITYDRRETLQTPYRFFLWRWFQKKQTVQVIEVKELNPYSTIREFKFIKVIK